MAVKEDMEYYIYPAKIDTGLNTLSLKIKNKGKEKIKDAVARLNTLDAYALNISGTGEKVKSLEPGKEKELKFQAWANSTGAVFASIDGVSDEGGKKIHRESFAFTLQAGRDTARIFSLFALSYPYSPVDKKLKCEAAIEAMAESRGLSLEFWLEPPAGQNTILGSVKIKDMKKREMVSYSAEFTPENEGIHAVHAYLYKGSGRIGHKLVYVHVKEGERDREFTGE